MQQQNFDFAIDDNGQIVLLNDEMPDAFIRFSTTVLWQKNTPRQLAQQIVNDAEEQAKIDQSVYVLLALDDVDELLQSKPFGFFGEEEKVQNDFIKSSVTPLDECYEHALYRFFFRCEEYNLISKKAVHWLFGTLPFSRMHRGYGEEKKFEVQIIESWLGKYCKDWWE